MFNIIIHIKPKNLNIDKIYKISHATKFRDKNVRVCGKVI